MGDGGGIRDIFRKLMKVIEIFFRKKKLCLVFIRVYLYIEFLMVFGFFGVYLFIFDRKNFFYLELFYFEFYVVLKRVLYIILFDLVSIFEVDRLYSLFFML